MDEDRIARPRGARSSAASRWTRQFLSAALGVGVALLLGGTGFALGCLYVIWSTPPAVALIEPAGGPEQTAALAPAVLVASADAGRPAAGDPGQQPALFRPVAGGWVSSHFGPRPDPFTGEAALHQGIDFAGPDNSPILAVAPGLVVRSGRQPGYGNLIEIDHGNGWISRYGHNAFNLVTPGDYVLPGQTIALMGATGRATGTHLHFEVLYRGRHQNPARFVPRET